ncbi:hypothetical protein H0N98_02465 [Candidatus Micrarchaeota archaeon]|nr:hypothetical protein [Candidatus Micrarchaeota archaeon]
MWKFDEGASGGETPNKSIEKEPAGSKKDKVIWSEFARIFGHEKKEPSEAVVKFVNFLKERERKSSSLKGKWAVIRYVFSLLRRSKSSLLLVVVILPCLLLLPVNN